MIMFLLYSKNHFDTLDKKENETKEKKKKRKIEGKKLKQINDLEDMGQSTECDGFNQSRESVGKKVKYD